jgi:dolichyl-diphosphooligosaccharide---protein glycosyltransferase
MHVSLGLIFSLCFFIRLFAVIRYESVIHEFDPYFNYRTSQYLTEEGFYEFWNWYDDWSWYPLGRVVGQTLFPGLMTTAAVFYYILDFLGLCVNIRNICVFMAPMFSGLTALAAYFMTKEATGGRTDAGLLAALFLGICPSYMSRSVAGSYDNEAIAIFTLTFSFYMYQKATRTGSILDATIAAFAYLYMVAAWGGYIFVINTIAIYVFALLLLGRLNVRHYVAYAVFYIIGTVFCLNIPFVANLAIKSSEHMGSHFVFLVSTAVILFNFVSGLAPGAVIKRLAMYIVVGTAASFISLFIFLTITGRTKWGGRSMTLLDPTYASKYVPIIASVSEHQPTAWSNYILDLNLIAFLSPVGLYYCFNRLSDGSLFLGVYGILAAYFSGVMIRLLLVLAPAASCLAAIGVNTIASSVIPFIRNLVASDGKTSIETAKKYGVHRSVLKTVGWMGVIIVGVLGYHCVRFVQHCVWTSSMAYSSPSIVMSQQLRDGTRIIQDDFREAYYWLRMNTKEDAKIMSWWDYGYQMTAMGNRTVLVDNNTWNNTHIATVGLILASTEKDALPILRKLDVDYVMVLYGGVARYSSDDIAKFLWPIRIANGEYPDQVTEAEFIGPRGYTVDETATQRMKNCVMYKLSYYRAAEVTGGKDLARNANIGVPDVKPELFREAFTSENWIVRIYELKKDPVRGTTDSAVYE